MNQTSPSRSDELNKLIRSAALTIDTQGRLKPLAKKAGIGYNAMIAAIRKGKLSPGMACALELAVGKDVLPKEKLCPETYTD